MDRRRLQHQLLGSSWLPARPNRLRREWNQHRSRSDHQRQRHRRPRARFRGHHRDHGPARGPPPPV